MEPRLIPEGTPGLEELRDLAWDLGQRSAKLAVSQSEPVREALTILVRSINGYYSNLIEGRGTTPYNIDQAMANQFQDDLTRRDRQWEAKAHIKVQEWIDKENGLAELGYGTAGVREIHRRFYEKLPPHMLTVRNAQTKKSINIVPGEFRQGFVRVGHHIPIEPTHIPRFMAQWEDVYTSLSPRVVLLAAATAHHRLLWIHPLQDGNGRVARLISHAMLKRAISGVDLWSVSRGWAYNENRYMLWLSKCDELCKGSTDGHERHGGIGQVDFTRYFLATVLNEVTFMQETLMNVNFPRSFLEWIRGQTDIGKGARIIEKVLIYGSIERGTVPELLGMPERSARRVVKKLFDHYLLQSDSHRAPLRLNIPLYVAQALFPSMMPERSN